MALDAGAQTLSFAPTTSAAPSGARGAASVDLNRDGWVDIVTANLGRNTVAILISRGAAGGFLPAREIAVGAGPFDIAAGDFDRNGVPDLVVTTPSAPAIEVLLMRADASVRSRAIVSTAHSRGVTVADVTRDGALDIVYTDYLLNRAVLLPGNGAGGFRPMLSWAVGSRPQGVTVADFNHDGFMDIAVALTNSTVLTVLHGTATTSVTARSYSAGRTLNVLAAADINADGWLDIAAVSTSTNAMSFFKGSAAGFALAGTRATGSSPRAVAFGDFNQDGRPDVAVGNRGSSSVTVLLARRDGSILPDRWGELPASPGARPVLARDFNNDGRMDIVAAAEFSSSLTMFANDTAFVRPAFSFRALPLGGFRSETLATADFNENGKPDLLSTHNVLLDTGTVVTLVADRAVPVVHVATADFNRDGHADALIARKTYDEFGRSISGEIDVYRGNGRGAFTLASTFGGMTNMWRFRMGDLNRDGRLDIIAQGDRELYVGLQTSSGGLQQTILPVESLLISFDVADINRDAILDVITLDFDDEALSVRLGNGVGGFGPRVVGASSVAANQLTVGDLNHDGRLDVVTDAGGGVGVILNAGDGSWLPQVRYDVFGFEPLPTGVVLGDFNHDGHLDVFTWTGSLLAGNGDGTLSAGAAFAALPFAGVPVDWNGDGLLDFVTRQEALINERRSQNRLPVANAGPDRTFLYHEQFEQGDGVLSAAASFDPDLHQLSYEWRDETGTIFDRQPRAVFPPKPPGIYTFTLTVLDGRGGEATDPFQITIARDEEIILHTRDVFPRGNWFQAEDESAASGVRMFYPNADAPKVTTPAANPAAYVEFAFMPDPALTYKLWVRLKAEDNRARNDSVWVQFSGAVDTTGKPNYRIGTTEGLAVNLEECLGCGISGWGWEDDGWGAVNRNGTLLRFPDVGDPRHVIRLQVREDGVSFDQIVLSAVKYRTTRPGAAKNDTTILDATQR